MKYLVLLIFLFCLISCSDNNKNAYTIPSKDEINDIVETIIIDDTVPVFINTKTLDTSFFKEGPNRVNLPIKNKFSVELEKNYVYFTSNIDAPPPPPGAFGINFSSLIEKSDGLFSRLDSCYLVFQNEILQHFTFSSHLIKRINITTSVNQAKKKEPYYVCSFPLFTAKKDYAFVEVIYRHYGLCGSSVITYVLKKTNNKWKVLIRKNL